MVWYVEFKHADAERQRIRIDEGKPIRIGRGSDSDTRIPDAALSRLHCEIMIQGHQLVVNDLGSSVGTFVGQEKIQSQALESGQTFRAGNTRFTVISESAMEAPTRMAGSPVAGQAAIIEKLQQRGRLDRFESLELINRSGRNLVYKGTERESGKVVAIKVIPTAGADSEDEARFVRAMETFQKMRDRTLVKMMRAGRKSQFCWVAMEWFDKGSIADRAAKQGINNCLDWKDVWQVAKCISHSLAVLEQAGIVHRSIRPTNILFRDSDKSWVLSDLVVAKAERESSNKAVTQQYFLPTDLAYTAPERLRGADSNEHSLAADIYSLGAVLTELLIGEPPFGRGDLMDILPRLDSPRKIVTRDAALGLNELVADLVNRMTEPDPRSRITSASKLQAEVERVGKLAGMPTA